ncbi:MAG: MBL fold metallo-hydrolase [Spirochaetales bacterium]|nr:MBL fold metallo-hydrolase [Spirochaetales bacterium]
MKKTEITNGMCYLEVPEINIRILCGCPENSIKFIMQKGLTPPLKINGFNLVGGPNAILLNDISVKNSHFLNFSEFPVLHHQYFQGAAFNGTNEKFILIGDEKRVIDQYEYIRCGLHGLLNDDDIFDSGVNAETGKRFLALGDYHRGPEKKFDIINNVYINGKTKIKDDLYIERTNINIFRFTYKEESIIINLNLDDNSKGVGLPYSLDNTFINFNDFSITTVGDGNGWNPDVPCMGALITAAGKRYLVDSGPGSLDLLSKLGVTPSEIEGVFVTHSHDDHFAGILSMLNSDRKVKFYSSGIVIKSVQIKFQSLLNITKDELKKFIDFIPLNIDKWNDIGDMEVKPYYSFHTIETNTFYFRRKNANNEYKTYGHITDIISRKDLNYMLDTDKSGLITKDWADTWFNNYFEYSNLKRIDSGGGVVHGDANDFTHDTSDKIILSHLNHDIDTSGNPHFVNPTPFGYTEVLIENSKNYLKDLAETLLEELNFKDVKSNINNSKIIQFKPSDVIVEEDSKLKSIFLVLSGLVDNFNGCSIKKLIRGNFLYGFKNEKKSITNYIANSYVNVIELDISYFTKNLKWLNLTKEFQLVRNNCFFTYGFSFKKYLELSNISPLLKGKKNTKVDWKNNTVLLLCNGSIEQYSNNRLIRKAEKYGLFYNEESSETIIMENSNYILFSSKDLNLFPSILWSIFEIRKEFETIVEIAHL